MLKKRERYEKIIRFAEDYTAKNGCPPTLAEIASRLSVSVSTAYRCVKELEEAGLLNSGSGKKRSITVKNSEAKGKAVPVPVYSEPVSSSGELFPQENILFWLWLPVSKFGRDEYFAAEADENGFIPEDCRAGDYIIFKKTPKARNGDTVMIKKDSRAAAVRLRYAQDGFTVQYGGNFTENIKEAEILGRAVAMQRIDI